MLSSDIKFVKKEGQYVISGSAGELLICGITGNVLAYFCSPDADAKYSNIARFNVAEYVLYNGRMDDAHILLIGYWDDDGYYEDPVRGRRGEKSTAFYQYLQSKNARIAEVVPDLLAALVDMVDMFERHIDGREGPDDSANRWDRARAAIEKAKAVVKDNPK